MANTTGQGRQKLSNEIQLQDGDPGARLVVPQIRFFNSSSGSAVAMSIEDDILVIDATTTAVTVTLPKADLAYRAKPYKVFKIDSSANTVTVDGAGSETIEGSANVVISTRYGNVEVQTTDNLAWVRAGGTGAGASGSAPIVVTDVQGIGPINLDLIGTNAAEIRFQMGFAGMLKAVRAISSKATIATGNAVVTVSKGGVNCTGGALTFQVGNVVGTKKSSSITAGGSFAIGDEIRILVSGTNDAAAFAGVVLDYSRA